MQETVVKTQTQAEWYNKPMLTQSELRMLIAEKAERARLYHEAVQKREAVVKTCR